MMHFYPSDTHTKLEFDKVLELLSEACLSELGQAVIAQNSFSTNHAYLNEQLDQVVDVQSMLLNGIQFPTQNYYSLEEEIAQLQIANNVLDGKQFRRIAALAETIESIFTFFKKHPDEYASLKRVMEECTFEKKIVPLINKVIDEKGIVHANASPELMRIRRQLNSKNNAIQKVFGKLVQQYKLKGILADASESVRNNRRVLSVQAESKRTITGIVHDESDSGKTSYIEPQETVLLNNELFELERAEQREVYKILQGLTAEIAIYGPYLEQYTKVLGQLDAIRAKAKLALKMDAKKPILVKHQTIELREAFHPLLLLLNNKTSKPTVPLSVTLTEEQHVLLISGPNAGGKSVSLKTIGLQIAMLQFGLLIPCDENSKIGLFKEIYTDLGDNQSIENELSTYSSRLSRMKYFIENAGPKTLYLIDEFGTGTDPRFGAAMAEAILLRMLKRKAFGIVTTHYSNLKKIGEITTSILNGAMLFNESSFAPTYRLKTGKPGSSYTFAIAAKIGMANDLIEEAKGFVDYSDLKFDELIAKVEAERKQLERENSNIKKENKQLKGLQQKFEILNKQLEKQMAQHKLQLLQLEQDKHQLAKAEVNAVLNKINKAKSKEKAAIATKKQLSIKEKVIKERVTAQELSAEEIADLNIGDTVTYQGNEGEVIAIQGKYANIDLNGMRSKVPLKRLEKITKKKEEKYIPKHIIKKDVLVENVFDIRGLSHDDAYLQIEQYMDQALLNNLHEIKIIHGKGMGILRKLVQRIIREYKTNILEWQYEEAKKGGDGATIIRFK